MVGAGDPDADDTGAPLKAPPPSMASSLFGSSVPMNIPRQFTGAGRTLLSQSLLAQAAAQLGGEAASLRVGATLPPVPEHDNLVAPSADDLDPADPSGQVRTENALARMRKEPSADMDDGCNATIGCSSWRRTSLPRARLSMTRPCCLASARADDNGRPRRQHSKPRTLPQKSLVQKEHTKEYNELVLHTSAVNAPLQYKTAVSLVHRTASVRLCATTLRVRGGRYQTAVSVGSALSSGCIAAAAMAADAAASAARRALAWGMVRCVWSVSARARKRPIAAQRAPTSSVACRRIRRRSALGPSWKDWMWFARLRCCNPPRAAKSPPRTPQALARAVPRRSRAAPSMTYRHERLAAALVRARHEWPARVVHDHVRAQQGVARERARADLALDLVRPVGGLVVLGELLPVRPGSAAAATTAASCISQCAP